MSFGFKIFWLKHFLTMALYVGLRAQLPLYRQQSGCRAAMLQPLLNRIGI